MLSATNTDSVKNSFTSQRLDGKYSSCISHGNIAISCSNRLEGVNRPDLLPTEKGLNVIQTENFLTKGQAKRMNDLLTNAERDAGYQVKIKRMTSIMSSWL